MQIPKGSRVRELTGKARMYVKQPPKKGPLVGLLAACGAAPEAAPDSAPDRAPLVVAVSSGMTRAYSAVSLSSLQLREEGGAVDDAEPGTPAARGAGVRATDRVDADQHETTKMISLVLLTVQFSAQFVVTRYTRTLRGPMYRRVAPAATAPPLHCSPRLRRHAARRWSCSSPR